MALKSEWAVRPDLAVGTRVTVFGDFAPKPNRLQMIYPAGVVQSRHVRALKDYLAEALDQQRSNILDAGLLRKFKR